MWFAAWIILIYIFQKPSCLLQSLALFICGFQQSVKSRWHYRFCVFLSGLWYANWCSERMWNELTTKSQENPFKVKRKGEGERKEWLKRDCKQGEQCAYTSTWVSFPFFLLAAHGVDSGIEHAGQVLAHWLIFLTMQLISYNTWPPTRKDERQYE